MNKRNLTLIVANLLLFAVGLGGVAYKHHAKSEDVAAVVVEKPVQGQTSPINNKPELPPVKINVSNATPTYMNYLNTVAQLKKWNTEAPEMTEVGTYGKSTRGTDLYYFRIVNKRYSKDIAKPTVLITACIHGNEPLASSTVMWWIGGILSRYSADPKIAEMVDQRDIYFIPVVSPDSYPNSRQVDGVDPNRNFPTASDPNRRSVAPIQALREFHAKIKPNAVISGHTWGRVFLIPWGDQMKNCPDHNEYKRVVGKMSELSGYRNMRACDMYGTNGLNNPPIEKDQYGTPIYGSEVDWYYRNGSFAIVCEFGKHQRVPSDEDTRAEFNLTFTSALHFIREAPLVQVRP